jgi:outer membrane protein OmpA-like peptidoglycan-associated protein
MKHRTLHAVLSGLLATAAGCTADQAPAECPTTPAPGVAIAVGARANTPAPVLAPELAELLETAIQNEQAITLVRVDGTPTIACVLRFHSDAENDVAHADDERRFRERLLAVVGAVRAREPGADPMAALAVAADAAGRNGTVVLLDSGLQTLPPLDFTEPEFLGQVLAADPATVAAKLRKDGALPDFTGQALTLTGIGYVADPQPRLDEGEKQGLVRLWRAIAESAGARSVVIVPAASTRDAVPAVPEVPVVELPSRENIAFGCDTTAQLHDTGPVGFMPDSTDFADPVAAANALREYATWLAEDRSRRAELTGTIAHYGENKPDHGLALWRAQAVANELIRLGADEAQVRASGAGWGPYPHSTAPADPRYDSRNRRVLIELRC